MLLLRFGASFVYSVPMSNATIQPPTELTKEGLAELQQELLELESVKLPAAIERLTIAREHGDLSENAEYHSARDDKELIETRLDQIKAILENAVLVRTTKSTQYVGVGSVVVIRKKGVSKTTTVTLVGEFEAEPASGKISISSPLGKALLKKKVGDSVIVKAPAGMVEYLIVTLK